MSKGLATKFIGINARGVADKLMATEMKVNFSLYQSTHTKRFWSQLGGLKDDVFVYDSCGRLTYFIPFPHSFVPARFLELAIQSTNNDNPCSSNNDPSVIVKVEQFRGISRRPHHISSSHLCT
jgi:hypothetical protein